MISFYLTWGISGVIVNMLNKASSLTPGFEINCMQNNQRCNKKCFIIIDQNFTFAHMPYFLKLNMKIVLLIFILSIPAVLFSQTVVLDTTIGYSFPLTEDDQLDLNNFLMLAASAGNVTAIHWLMKQGADINWKSYEDVTPLMFAVTNNKVEAVKALLKYDPEIDAMTIYSETPLLAAVKNGNMDIVETLIRDSANINLADKNGATPLHYSSIYGYFYITDMLLYYGAETNTRSKDGTTPLMAVIWSGFADITDLLIQYGANCDEKDNQGFTPLMIAAQNGDTLIMEMLLKKGVNIYEINSFNYDALDLCIKADQNNAIEYLFKKGYKWSSKLPKTISPYSVATKYSRTKIMHTLEENQIPDKHQFGIDQVAFSVSAKLCSHDYFTGLNLAFKEPLLNGGIITGIDFKPGYTRVLQKMNENLYYQYMDRSSTGYIGLFKNLPLTNKTIGGNWSFTTSVAAAYSFGNKLKGTNIEPETKFKIIPAAGLKWEGTRVSIFGDVEYMKTKFYRIGPIWMRAGAAFNFFFDNDRAPGKIIKWY